MPNIDDELRRRMQRAGRRVRTDGLESRLHARRAHNQITQKVGLGFLAVAVLAASAVGVAGLNRAFRGNHPGSDASSGGTIAFIRFLRPCTAVPNITDDGGLQIFTVDIATGEQRLIRVSYRFPSDPLRLASPQAPAFSPDGTSVAWRDHYQGGLYVTDVATGATQHLAPGIQVGDPHWSPDGSKLLFIGWDTGSGDPDPRLLAQSLSGIYSVAPDGSALTRLTTNAQLPIWTSDGRIAFMRLSTPDVVFDPDSGEPPSGSPGTASFFLLDADGSNVQKQYEGPGDVPIHEAEWSPDGNRIVASATLHGNTDIFSVDLTLRATSRLTDDPADDTSPSWSADGSLIAFHTGRWGTGVGHSEIAVMNADGSGVRRLTSDCWDDYDATWVKNDASVRTLPRWAPPARPDLGQPQIPDRNDILVEGSQGGFSDLYALDPKTGRLANLTADYASQGTPAWSPDHSKIAFSGDVQEPGNYDIYVMDADGSDLQRLTTDPEGEGRPSWAPDGSALSFEGSGGSGIWTVNVDGSGLRQLSVPVPVQGAYSSWSPDGKTIAFADGSIYITRLADGRTERLFEAKGGLQAYELEWSPDGSRLLFTCDRDICAIDADGGGFVNLTAEPGVDTYEREADWSPDGSHIVFLSDRDSGEQGFNVFTMNADGTEVTSLGAPPDCCHEPDW